MVLTVFAIEKAKASDKPLLLTDGNGLHLLVNPNGSKLWRLRYRFAGKQNLLSLRSYPEVSLAQAPAKRDDARRLNHRQWFRCANCKQETEHTTERQPRPTDEGRTATEKGSVFPLSSI